MNTVCAPDIQQAVDALWQAGRLTPCNLYAAPAFIALRQACQASYPGIRSQQSLNFALSQALYNLGFRWTADVPSQYAIAPEIAANKIGSALGQTRSRRIHLCPLDQADEVPLRHFGPNSVRRFTAEELIDVVDPSGIMRMSPELRFDTQRFAQFSWLVVEEIVDVPSNVEARALPLLLTEFGADFGCIEPHKPLFPQPVELAIFMLLTVPWEDITVYGDIEWRPFRIPWVYTIDDDLFARRPTPPSADSLSWEPDFYEGADGGTIECERPARLRLEDDAEEQTRWLDNDAWQ